MLHTVGTFSGQQGFRVWETKLRNAVTFFAPDLKPILAGTDSPAGPEPDEGDSAKWNQTNIRQFSLLFFVTSWSVHATVLTNEEAVDGTAAWKALNERLEAHTQEGRRACHRELFGLRHLQGLVANLVLQHSAGQVKLPNIGSAHLAQSTPAKAPQAPAKPTSFGFLLQRPTRSTGCLLQAPPAASAATPAAPLSISSELPAQDDRLPSGFFGAFMATPAEMSLSAFRSDGLCIRMVVDSGATNNYLDPALSSGVRAHICNVEDLQVPHTIVAAGQHLLKGVTTGTIFGAVMDDNGNNRRVSFRFVMVPELVTNLFSVTAAMQKEVATLFHPPNPRLESGDMVIQISSRPGGVSGYPRAWYRSVA